MQLASNQDQERLLPPVPPRRPRLKFSAEVALLEAAGRGDYHEGLFGVVWLEHSNPKDFLLIC